MEKPRDPEVLAQFVSRDEPERPYLGSMGIYIFNTDVLIDLLENSTFEDFGGQIIPNAISSHRVIGFDFDGYWEDIGTIRSFYETNLSLTRPNPPFNFYDPVRPIYTRPRYLPGSVIDGATLHNVLLADGCQIHSSVINDSIVGLRSQIAEGVRMNRTIMMGADYYDPPGRSPASRWALAPTARSKAPSSIKTCAWAKVWSSAPSRAARTWKRAAGWCRMALWSSPRTPSCSRHVHRTRLVGREIQRKIVQDGLNRPVLFIRFLAMIRLPEPRRPGYKRRIWGVLHMLLHRAQLGGAHQGGQIFFREGGRHLDFQVDLANHAGRGIGVHALHDADALGWAGHAAGRSPAHKSRRRCREKPEKWQTGSALRLPAAGLF